MDEYIDARFERLEKALAALIDSVAKFNPSVSSAVELEAADSELQAGLVEVQKHQNNHLRILKLQAATTALDNQIRDTIQTLATTRKDLRAAPATIFPPGIPHGLSYEDLLGYARRITKTSLPPAHILQQASQEALPPNGEDTQDPNKPAEAHTPSATTATPTILSATLPSSSANTPLSTTPSTSTPNPSFAGQGPAAGSLHDSFASQGSQTSLPEPIRQWLNPTADLPFFPWPDEEAIRTGALAANQALVEQGIDPRGYDPQVEAERRQRAEQEEREREEQEQRERDQRERELREERARRAEEAAAAAAAANASQSSNAGAAGGSSGGPRQFQFTSLDMDDDDDDDD